MRLLGLVACLAGLVGCGSSAGGPPSSPDASSAKDSNAPAPEAAADASCGATAASPGQVRCAATMCTTPAEVCCYDQATPRCVAAAACNGSSIACDESTDCAPSGAYCCSGTSVVEPDAGFPQVTVGTFCSTSPMTCLPQPGVGSSSTLACQVDSECTGTGSSCLSHVCSFNGFSQCIRLCGPAGVTGCD
jgi:hypothetical protein